MRTGRNVDKFLTAILRTGAKNDYIASKTIYGFLAGAIFLVCFFVGALLGGAFSGLSFATGAAGIAGVVMCMLSKIFLMAVFIAIFLLMAVIGRQRSWLSILLSLFGGMLMFMMIPAMTPLDAGHCARGLNPGRRRDLRPMHRSHL